MSASGWRGCRPGRPGCRSRRRHGAHVLRVDGGGADAHAAVADRERDLRRGRPTAHRPTARVRRSAATASSSRAWPLSLARTATSKARGSRPRISRRPASPCRCRQRAGQRRDAAALACQRHLHRGAALWHARARGSAAPPPSTLLSSCARSATMPLAPLRASMVAVISPPPTLPLSASNASDWPSP